MEASGDLRLALRCSDLAGELALRYFESGVASTLKGDGTPVTEADRAVERLLQATLAADAPGDALLGEEFGRVGASARVWLLDPIDGTTYFVRRDPNWRVHVALEVAGRTEVAVVTAPALGRQWWAVRRGGAFESSWPDRGDGARMTVSPTATMDDATLDAYDDAARARLPGALPIATISATTRVPTSITRRSISVPARTR